MKYIYNRNDQNALGKFMIWFNEEKTAIKIIKYQMWTFHAFVWNIFINKICKFLISISSFFQIQKKRKIVLKKTIKKRTFNENY